MSTRTADSVVKRYETGEWSPDYSSTLTDGNINENWSRLLRADIATQGATNKITVTYIVSSATEVVGGGYVYMDYVQIENVGNKPVLDLVNKVTDGQGSLVSWVVDYAAINVGMNRLGLYFNVKKTGLKVQFSVGATTIGAVGYINTSPGFATWNIPSDAKWEKVQGNRFFESNDNEDIYNTNYSGRIGVNTGSTINSNVILDVNGNIAINGDIRMRKNDSDEIIIDSRTDLGYYYGMRTADGNVPIFYIDDAKQFGLGTNVPRNKIHVVGNAQITERTSIGAGNTPDAKLHIKGEGDTYDTMSIYAVNSAGEDLIRVHDDGSVWFKEIIGGVVLQPLHFGNGLEGADYDGQSEITVSIGNLIGSPTGDIYTP